MGNEALAIVDAQALTVSNPPEAVISDAQKAATALKDVIARKPRPVKIGGEQYLEFEDWQTVGRFYGVTVGSEGEPEFVDLAGVKGFKATAIALRNGQTISRATAYCMSDEPRWAKAPTYQVASMAQTRACAKALRNVLSWVAVLAGYKPTPAEEMDAEMAARPQAHREAAGPQGPQRVPSETPACGYCGSVNVKAEPDAPGWLRCLDCNKGTNLNKR